MSTDRPKSQTPQYYVMEKIAQGGMAEIFKGRAYDAHGLDKFVCIKKILPHIAASREFIDSLIDEAKLAVKLVHGNIAQTYDLGKVGDDYFMVMEFVDGKTLSQINKKVKEKDDLIPIPFLCYFISELLNGLNYMHRRTDERGTPLHIVHRDISPQNIMVAYSGTVKIIDFGIAKAAVTAASTDSGILKGKFAYMSPEQAHGDAIDHRSDVFSAGIILHEMLTGRRLFKAQDSRETIRNVRRAKVEAPSAERDDLPEELDRITLRALAKDRRHRYSFASEMHDDLVKFLHTNYPQFKPSDAAAFVQELFRDEIEHPKPVDADAKTPHLIIDGTNSALAGDEQFEITGAARAPVDLKEYMVEDETPGPLGNDTVEPPDEEPPGEEPHHLPAVEAEDERTVQIWRRFPSLARNLRRAAIVVGICAVAAAIGLAAGRYLHRQPRLLAEGARLAGLIVVTNPADATVEFDGKVMGSGSPVTIRNIEADAEGDEHALVVSKDGFIPFERKVTLKSGDFQSVTATLTQAAPRTGTIEIVSNPPGARVYINDAETSYHTPAIIPGQGADTKMTVGLFLDGFKFWTKELSLNGGETKSFDVTLAKDFGALSIDSSPSGSLVMLNDVPSGQTPFKRSDLDPGKVYRVEVWHEGFKTYEKEIKVQAGREEELHVTLEIEPKPPPRQTPVPAGPKAVQPAGAAEQPAAPENQKAVLQIQKSTKAGALGAAAGSEKKETPEPPHPRGLIEEPAPIR